MNMKDIINEINIIRFAQDDGELRQRKPDSILRNREPAAAENSSKPHPTDIEGFTKWKAKQTTGEENIKFTTLYDLIAPPRTLDATEQQERNDAIGVFTKDFLLYRDKLFAENPATKEAYQERVVSAIRNKALGAPANSMTALLVYFNKDYPAILKKEFENTAAEMGLNISPADATKISERLKSNKPDWTLAQWFNTLNFLIRRAQNQMAAIQEQLKSFEEDDPQRKQLEAIFKIKERYATAAGMLRSELQVISKKGNEGQGFGPNDKISDDMLMSVNSGKRGRGGVGGRPGFDGFGGRGGQGGIGTASGGGGGDLSTFKRYPFAAPSGIKGRDRNLIYIKSLINAYGLSPSQYKNLTAGPFTLAINEIERNWANLTNELSGTKVDAKTYLYELSDALADVWGRFQTDAADEPTAIAEQERIYKEIASFLERHKRSLPGGDPRNQQQTQQPGQPGQQAQQQNAPQVTATDKAWYQLRDAGEITKFLKPKGFEQTVDGKNQIIWTGPTEEQKHKGDLLVVASDGSMWENLVFTPRTPDEAAEAGASPWIVNGKQQIDGESRRPLYRVIRRAKTPRFFDKWKWEDVTRVAK